LLLPCGVTMFFYTTVSILVCRGIEPFPTHNFLYGKRRSACEKGSINILSPFPITFFFPVGVAGFVRGSGEGVNNATN